MACQPRNVLYKEYSIEIWCQTLSEFQQHGLSKRDLMKWGRRLPIVYPWNPEYNAIRLNYNRRYNYFPMAIIRCREAQDVVDALEFCLKYELKFRLRSGGHCYLDYSLSTEIVIDLFLIQDVQVMKRGNIVSVGAGARLGQVVAAISPYNLTIPVGSCVNTGTAGLTLGGGISPSLIRKSGLTCDHLKAVEIVVIQPDGKKGWKPRVLCVSKNRYGDLFRSLQGGGGGNFGVVTKLYFTPNIFQGALVFVAQWPWKMMEVVFDQWQRKAPLIDPNLSSEINLRPPRFHPDDSVELKGQYEISKGQTVEEARKHLQQLLRELVPHSGDFKIEYTRTSADSARFWGTTIQTYFYANSIFWMQLASKEAIEIYRRALESAPGSFDGVEFNALGGRVAERKPGSSAFPWRKALFWSQQTGKTLDPRDQELHRGWVTKLYQQLSAELPSGVIPAYVNAPQAELTVGRRYLPAYYGENVDRLMAAKKRYDPGNFFSFPQSIPL